MKILTRGLSDGEKPRAKQWNVANNVHNHRVGGVGR